MLSVILPAVTVLPKVVGLMTLTPRSLVPRREGHGTGADICGTSSATMRTSFQAALIASHGFQIGIEMAPPVAHTAQLSL